MTKLAVERPVRVLTVWLALVCALGLIGAGIASRLHSDELIVPGTPSREASVLVYSHFGESFDTLILLRGPHAAIERDGPRFAAQLERIPGVEVMAPWLLAGNNRSLAPSAEKAILVVRSFGSFDHVSNQVIERVRADTRRLIRAPLVASVSGYGDIAHGIQSGTVEAIELAELIAAPFLILILLAVFRSPIAAALPLLVGFTTIAAAQGVLSIVNGIHPLDALALNITSMMGLALGVDYALLMVSRFREELRPGVEPRRAAHVAARAAGHTILCAGIALVACMTTSILVVPGNLLVGVGIGLIVAVVLSVLTALTALPAALTLLGGRLDRWTLGTIRPGESRASGLALRTLRHPAIAGAIVLALVLGLSLPTLSLDTGPPSPRDLPASSVEYSDYATVEHALGGGWVAPYEIDLAAKHGSLLEPGPMLAIFRLERALAQRHDVAAVLGPGQVLETKPFLVLDKPSEVHVPGAGFVLNLDRGGTAARITVVSDSTPLDSGDPLRAALERRLAPLAKATGASVRLGGIATGLQDFDGVTAHRLPLLAAWLALVTLIVLVGVLRSLPLALLAVALNVLTVGAAFGVLTICFQGADPLFGGPGFVDAITAFGVYSIMFGLSIDYEVFLLMRMREGRAASGSSQQAIAYGVQRTAGIITGAALIMTAVFAAFMSSKIVAPRELGVALTFAVLLDATLVRLVLLPSAMRLCGEAIWWFPRPLERLLGPSFVERTARARPHAEPDPEAA